MGKLVNLVVAASLLYGVNGSCVPQQVNSLMGSAKIEQVEKTNSLGELVESVYCVRTERVYEDPYGKRLTQIASGSALAYQEEGNYSYIITNQHLMGDEEIYVNGGNFRKVSIAPSIVDYGGDKNTADDISLELVWESEKLDLAILRTPAKLKVLDREWMGDSNNLKYGEEVYLIGYPLGMFNAVTKGIVANPGKYQRGMAIRDEINNLFVPSYNRKILDLTVNPGNSGGPFFVKRNGEFYWMGLIDSYLIHQAGGPLHRENSGLGMGNGSSFIRDITDYIIHNVGEIVESKNSK